MNRWEQGLDSAVEYISRVRQWEIDDSSGTNTRLIDTAIGFVSSLHQQEHIDLDDEQTAWVFRSTANVFTHWMIQNVIALERKGVDFPDEALARMLAPLNFLVAECVVQWATHGVATDLTPEDLAKVWKLNPWEERNDDEGDREDG